MTYLPSLKKLQYLVKLHKLQHFGRTAEACFVSQSTLSAGISDLEEKLGTVLIERNRQSMVFTATGIELVNQAKEILSAASEFVATAEKADQFFESTLRLGIIPTIAPYVLPAYLEKLSKHFPKLKVLVREDLSDPLLERLRSGELDLLIIALPYPSESVECLELYTDHLQLVYNKNSQFKETIQNDNLSELPDNSVLLLEDGHCLKTHTLSTCHLFSNQQINNFSTNSLASIVEMVQYDMGVSFIPDMAIKNGILDGTDIIVHKGSLKEEAHREIGIAWRETSPFHEEFKELGKCLLDLHSS